MTFTRTPSGIANSPQFFNSDIIIYTEGSTYFGVNHQEMIPDEVFFQSLLSSIVQGKSIKVKCVGNKLSALSYVQPIIDSGLKNSIVILDRDYDGIFCSIVNNPAIVYTSGYSWESDFWTIELTLEIIRDLTFDKVDALQFANSRYSRGARRLRVLSALDASLQVSGNVLLPKNGGACGITIDVNDRNLVNFIEMKRLILKFKSNVASECSMSKEVLKQLAKVKYNRLIRGHLWHHVVTKIISYIYKLKMRDSTPSGKMILNLALNKFMSDPKRFMGESVYDYYVAEVTSRINI